MLFGERDTDKAGTLQEPTWPGTCGSRRDHSPGASLRSSAQRPLPEEAVGWREGPSHREGKAGAVRTEEWPSHHRGPEQGPGAGKGKQVCGRSGRELGRQSLGARVGRPAAPRSENAACCPGQCCGCDWLNPWLWPHCREEAGDTEGKRGAQAGQDKPPTAEKTGGEAPRVCLGQEMGLSPAWLRGGGRKTSRKFLLS